jgi:tRNA(adenine34) deaminase
MRRTANSNTSIITDDAGFMRIALVEARQAAIRGEVPVGAVLVSGGEIVAQAHNRRETGADPTAHAEILVLREAAQKQGHWRLSGATLYVTLEPCPMCAGAMVLARIDRLVYGATDPKAGAAGSLFNLVQEPRLNHRMEVIAGVLADECGVVLQEFFRERRDNKN